MSAPLSEGIVAAIDQRLATFRDTVTKVGTIASRTSTTDALVVLDGSQGTVPCKVAAGVIALESDRVSLIKAGRWWVVVGSHSFRGTRRYTVANRSSRPSQNLAYGDQIVQSDTDIEYRWNGSVWIPVAGQSVFAWYRGPANATSHKIATNVSSSVTLYTTASIEVEPSMLYLLSASAWFESGVAGTHSFMLRIYTGATIIGHSGERVYSGGAGGQRINIQNLPYLTGASQTSLQLTLQSDDGSGSFYDVYDDPTKQIYLEVTAGGRAATSVAT